MDKYLDPSTGRVCKKTGRRTHAHVEVVGFRDMTTNGGGFDEVEHPHDRWWVRAETLEPLMDAN